MYIGLLGSPSENISLQTRDYVGQCIQGLSTTDYAFVLQNTESGMMRDAYEVLKETSHELIVLEKKDKIFDHVPDEVAPVTDTFEQMKTIIKTSDAFVCMPGGSETLTALFMLLKQNENVKEAKPVYICNGTGEFTPLLAYIKKLYNMGYIDCKEPFLYKEIHDVNTLLNELALAEENKNRKER